MLQTDAAAAAGGMSQSQAQAQAQAMDTYGKKQHIIASLEPPASATAATAAAAHCGIGSLELSSFA
jgi:hypothetical protein